MLTTRWFNQDSPSFRPASLFMGAAETSRNITARVIDRDVKRPLHKFLEETRGLRTRQQGRQSHQFGPKNDANLALPPRFRQVLIESPL
ncbi:hypothetical protein TNCV_1073701 [Trichonephila clavipes]|uniref:Uncharacterized protein n=1 Tax=Trichonephila clavipes TaxID=2585209 RepID=A0A8X6STU2_TRICX|nr:hypothetical protein TNCV_1073701 [Trichonephila clavipes]